MKNFMVAKSQSHIFLNNLTLTNDYGNKQKHVLTIPYRKYVKNCDKKNDW